MLKEHLSKICPPTVRLEVEPATAASLTWWRPEGAQVQAGLRALRRAFGFEPILVREGGSIPILIDFKKILGVDALLLGLSLPDDNPHSPNEKFDLNVFATGMRMSAYLWQELAAERFGSKRTEHLARQSRNQRCFRNNNTVQDSSRDIRGREFNPCPSVPIRGQNPISSWPSRASVKPLIRSFLPRITRMGTDGILNLYLSRPIRGQPRLCRAVSERSVYCRVPLCSDRRLAWPLDISAAFAKIHLLMAEPKVNELMEKIVSLCKRRGFIFQSSEIYGGINGFWDYGPLGAELKRNVKEHWWRSMTQQRETWSGLDATIIMHPKIWEASGHTGTFSDPMVDCLLTKKRFRADQIEPQSGTRLSLRAARRSGQQEGLATNPSRAIVLRQANPRIARANWPTTITRNAASRALATARRTHRSRSKNSTRLQSGERQPAHRSRARST